MQPVRSVRTQIIVCNFDTCIAPYSASTTDTVAGLSSAGFMNTYGKSQQSLVKYFLGSRLITIHPSSLFIHHHGCIDVDIYDLCDTHQRRVYTYLFDTAGGFLASIICILATGRRQCCYR